MRPFVYERPASLAEASRCSRPDPTAVPLAGGTDLIIGLRDRSVQPRAWWTSSGVAELDGRDYRSTAIGWSSARAVMEDIANDERIRRDFTALAEAAAYVGSVQIRNRATLAGNICNASPAADTVPALLVYGAAVVSPGPGGSGASRSTTSSSGPGVTRSARRDRDVGGAAAADAPRGSVHLRRTRRRGHDLASVTLAVAVGRRRDHARLRQRGPAAAARRRRHRRAGGPGDRRAKQELLDADARRRPAVADLDAGEPGVPGRDAARAGTARDRARRSATAEARRVIDALVGIQLYRQRTRASGRDRAAPHAARRPARRPRTDRFEGVLPGRRVRRLHGDARRPQRRCVPRPCRGGGRRRGRDGRGPGTATGSWRASSGRSSRPAPPSAASASPAS